MNENKHIDNLQCKRCGAELASDSVFCEQCGKRVKPNKWLFIILAFALLLVGVGLWFLLGRESENMQQPKLSYTVSVLSADEAMGTAKGGGTYDTITTITIEAEANDGYRFVGWNDGNSDRLRKVVADHDQVYLARFDSIVTMTPIEVPDSIEEDLDTNDDSEVSEIPVVPETPVIPKFTIKVKTDDPNIGTVKGGGEYDSLAEIKIEAHPKNGYQFVSWTDGNKNRIRKVKVLCNQEYTARFQKIENKPIETYDLGWGNYTGPMKDGKPDGRPGKVTVTRTHDIIDASGNKITVYSGEKITATKFVNGLLKYGEIHRKDDSHLIFQAKTD